MKSNVFKYDLYRYFADYRVHGIKKIFLAYQIRYIKWLRLCQKKATLLRRIFLRYYSKKTHIQIPYQCKIGPGVHLLHFGRIVINHNVNIGCNCTICPGVLIGQEERGGRKGNPTIGNNVFIGTNATIVGKIMIGNDVLIAPNSFINFDVPDSSIVIGNPGKIIKKENAADGYIKNPIKLQQ